MRIIYTKNNTKICNSYLIKNKDIHDLVITIWEERRERNYPFNRTIRSYVCEIKAHNRLYKLGLFKSHTKDCDCEEPIKKWKDILFHIIGI